VYRKQGGTQLVVASGGSIEMPVQTLTSADTATTVTNFGMSVLQATTTGPTYTMAAPELGVWKHLAISHTSSGVTHRCVVRSNSTGVQFDTTGGNQITFATSALRSVTLVAQTTAAWKIVGTYSGASIAAPRTT
jgi:hypothetical protein